MIFIIVSVILSLDQFTKFLIVRSLAYNQSVPVINGILHFTLIHNRGAAFGILRDQLPLFIVTSVFAIILVYLNLKANKHRKSYSVALSFIFAGAIGNLIDRIFLGYVIDFLDFRIWPVFNVADSAITVGAIMLGFLMLVKDGKAGSRKLEAENSK